MSLRLRMTLLYSVLLGAVLLLFGFTVYGLVSLVLTNQVDENLAQSTNHFIATLRVLPDGSFDLSELINLRPGENYTLQLWDNQHDLIFSRPEGFDTPLDLVGRDAGRSFLNTVQIDGGHSRVFSVPLQTGRRPVGVIQVAISLNLLEVTQSTLGKVLIILSLLAIVLAAAASWGMVGRTLSPLATVTQVAAQITRADDLSRRIPQVGAKSSDEVGALILAFNQTLERLEQLFSAQRRLLADVSHELRTPLTVIKGNLGLMRKMGAADIESLDGIEAEVDRLTRLAGDLLVLMQAETGRLPLDKQPVELDAVLAEVARQMKVLAGERLQVRVVEIDQVHVIGDRDRLKQVLLNLASNAVQYTPAGGVVSLGLRRDATEAVLTISDNGPGIPAQDLPHIFERFYRAEKSRKRVPGTGFGLGLSIAYWIVRSHEGRIEVDSQEGRGTTFRVSLPLEGSTLQGD